MKRFILVLLGLMVIIYPLYAIYPMVSGGMYHTAALDSDGKVYAWGWNDYGQLGDNSNTESHVPVEVDASDALSGKTITAIAAGYYHTIALDSEGKVYAWGDNGYGQLGNNSTTHSNIPVAVNISGVLSGKTITAIAAGTFHTVALDSDEKIYAWGWNKFGQLGDNTTTNSNVPIAVNTSGVLSGKTITVIAAGCRHTVALDSDGKVYAWGDNEYGQLGDNSTSDSHVPTSGVLSDKTITAIATGVFHTVALDSDGKIYAWGANAYGQLGDNSTTRSHVPVEVVASGVLSGKTITAIATGHYHTLALDSEGKVYTWGYNNYGQLGDNSTTNSSVPVKVLGVGGVGEIALPITLLSFTAQGQQGNIVLTWQTVSETNNARFLIYCNSVAITSIDGAGTSSEPHTYEYIDDQIIPGNTYTYILADVSYANEETKYSDRTVTVILPENDIPTEFTLKANYPNPFNPTTAIRYQLSAISEVNLSIYDMNGKKVATLVNGSKLAGYHSVNWDASNISSGIYFYRLQAGDFVDTKKMVFMK